ncbi:MAG: type II secretion system F family protein [Candidatus Omnitrophica bacterium]|nr:type II secretion system F family protein [Candidatus Omnitrophota bacterium]
MAIYKYRAKKDPENIVEGKIEAFSEKEAIEKISSMGYLPVHLEKAGETSYTQTGSSGKSSLRVRSREITVASRQLSSLLKSGVPILNALNIIGEQSEDPNLKGVLGSIHDAVKEGSSFSQALEEYPAIFSPLYIALIRTGENSGALADALLRISDYRVKQEEMFSRFRMALAYPVLMAIVGCGTVVFMLAFVMPRLMRMYVNMEQKLPLPTQILISITEGLQKWWFWILLFVILASLVFIRQAKTKAGKLSLSLIKLHIPVFGEFILKAELARFSRTLELLIKSGIPILNAIDISIPVLDNEIVRIQLKKSYKELEQGGSLGRSLKSSKLFPLFMSNLIIVGEESGKLDDALKEVANSYEKDTDEAIRVMGSLLEPVMILVMGLIVGFIVIAMLLPIFGINMMVK